MNRSHNRSKTKNRRVPADARGRTRLRWVVAGGALAWAILGGRLVQLQAIEHHSYATLARDQHERWVELAARRGNIIDRAGRELALDMPSVSFYCDPATIEHPETVADHFASRTGRSKQSLMTSLSSGRSFMYLARQISEEEAEGFRLPSVSGVREQRETRRYYPFGHLAGQLLGFADVDNRGREGLELAYEVQLRETEGKAVTKVDAKGKPLSVHREERKASRNGSRLRLTIDAVFQDILESELVAAVDSTGSMGAYGIISRPQTGEILAMASVPLFDPNNPGMYEAQTRRNRAVTDSFEPGSTFKAITAAAVIEEGLATAKTRVFCEEGSIVLANGDTLRDVNEHGWLDTRSVLSKSSNIGTIKLARRLDRPRYYQYLRNFGFGTRTAIGLPAESAGLLRHARDWSERSLETIAIGQEVSVTALQLVQAFGAIANGGLLMSPRILRESPRGSDAESEQPDVVRRVISENTAATMRSILASVVRDGSGRRAGIEGVAVAGKTGTAQRAMAEGGGYEEDEYIVSFVGFLPAQDPEYLCLVVMLNPQTAKWGGQVAAPVFKRVMEKVYFRAGRSATSVALAENAALQNQHRPRPMRWPDLRGMNVDAARYHCRLRNLDVVFAGSGSIVVRQDARPGENAAERPLTCTLGDPENLLFAPAGMPVRQTVLFSKLRRPDLAFTL